MKLSFVIPVFNEEGNLRELHERIVKSVPSSDYEIIFVDDGSRDGSLGLMRGLSKSDEHVRIIVLRRNFGKSAALAAGFELASGDVVFTMDADLQDDPVEVPRFLEALKKYDLVVGWKKDRKDPITKRVMSKFFNILTSLLTGVRVHDSNCGFKAMRADVAKNIWVHGELHRYIPVLAHMSGFNVGEIVVQHHQRKWGRSKYGVERLVKGALDLITVWFLSRFSQRPGQFFGSLGALSISAGLIAGAYLLYVKYVIGELIGNRPLLTLSVLLVVIGIQFVSIGLIGEMIVSKRSSEGPKIIREVV